MFESLESRRLFSVVGSIPGVKVTQSSGGALTVSTDNNFHVLTIVEAGTRNGAGVPAGAVEVREGSNVVDAYDVTGNVNASLGGGGGDLSFDGNLHALNFNGAGGYNTVQVNDEGAGGSTIQCGGGINYVQVVFSHHAIVHDGGGMNTILLNTEFAALATSSGGVVTSAFGNTVHLGNSAADYMSVQVGGGTNNILAYAGNVDVKAGGGFDSLYVQGYTGPSTGFDKTFSTAFVDILSDKGIDQVLST